MKYFFYLALLLVALIAIFLFYSGGFTTAPRASSQAQQTEQASEAPTQWETKRDGQPPVTVAITPNDLGAGAKRWTFAVVLDTHTGSLDDDPTEVITLSDDMGNTYRALAWEGPGPGGHHREGVLVFEPLDPRPPYVELSVKNVGGVGERVFRWDTQ